MQLRRCCVAVVLMLLGLAVACGSGQTSAGSATVTVRGRIGPLQLDRSNRARFEERGLSAGGHSFSGPQV